MSAPQDNPNQANEDPMSLDRAAGASGSPAASAAASSPSPRRERGPGGEDSAADSRAQSDKLATAPALPDNVRLRVFGPTPDTNTGAATGAPLDRAAGAPNTWSAEGAQSSPSPYGRRGGWGVRFARYAWSVLSWAAIAAAAVAIIGIAALILLPRAMGWEGMVVLSGSMEPALETGGLAFMEPLDDAGKERIQPGDIITFRNTRSNTLVSHRVVETGRDAEGLFFVTKGDANTEVDGTPVRESRVVGKVRFDVPELGNFVRKLQDRNTYYLVLGIPAGLLIAGEAWNIVKEVRRNGRNVRANAGQGVGS